MTSILGRGLALSLALSAPLACDDSKGGDSKGAADKGAADKGGDKDAGSELAKKADKEVADIKAELEKGEDIKYACAGNLAQYEELNKGSDGDKKSYAAMLTVCFVDGPKKIIEGLRAKIKDGKLDTFDTVTLETTIDDDKFPKDGEAAKVAADAKKLLEIEIPVYHLNEHLALAKKDKEAGETVSMGCIKAKQVVTKSGEALKGDDTGKAALAAFETACPEKK